MRGHTVCFYGKLRKIIPRLSLSPLLICSTVPSTEAKLLRITKQISNWADLTVCLHIMVLKLTTTKQHSDLAP